MDNPGTMDTLESAILLSLAIWFGFYLLNYAAITVPLRTALKPIAPGWLVSLLSCPLCLGFWTMVGLSLFSGFTPMVLWVPPMTLFIDLLYRRLSTHP